MTYPPTIDGVGKHVPTVTNEQGGKQSASPYRMDLVPPRAILEVSKVLKRGAEKYNESDDDPNWHRIPVRDHLNHALVHITAYLAGDKQDSHLSHAACRALMALELELKQKGGAS